ncbi:MAG: CBS domain-containing protein [Planctomycetota bacterium]
MASAFKAEDYMVKELVTVRPETDAYDAIGLLLKHRISGMPVVDQAGNLVGILSERDCLKTLLEAQYHNLPTALVKDLMSTGATTITPDTDILKVADLFLNERFRRLPVVDKGRLVGQISRRDVLRAIQEVR